MNPWTRLSAAVTAALGWWAIAAQCYWAATPAAIVNVLSYFTIWTNILAASVLTIVAARDVVQSSRFPTISQQTAIASYIFIVGIVYEFLLRRLWNPTEWRFVADMILHNLVPIGYVAFWLLAVPRGRVQYRHVWRWTLYPFTYLAYCLLRGHTDRFFPYPFVDFRELGYPRFALNVFGLIVAFVGTGLAFIAIDRQLYLRQLRRIPTAAQRSD